MLVFAVVFERESQVAQAGFKLTEAKSCLEISVPSVSASQMPGLLASASSLRILPVLDLHLIDADISQSSASLHWLVGQQTGFVLPPCLGNSLLQVQH